MTDYEKPWFSKVIAWKSNKRDSARSMELYDPDDLSSNTRLDTILYTPRFYHTSTVLPDGSVFIIGGKPAHMGFYEYYHSARNSVEAYKPSTGEITSVPDLQAERPIKPGVAVLDGMVFVCGGGGGSSRASKTCEK